MLPSVKGELELRGSTRLSPVANMSMGRNNQT